jgi:hypothetical protein
MKTLIVCILFSILTPSLLSQSLAVTNPRCEYKSNPLGIDVLKPRFSWELQSAGKNIRQTAYRVLVADDPVLLKNNTGNIWDSKKVNSAASIQVEFNGKALQSADKYFWKVMVWDNNGNMSAWSKDAFWQMGLLSREDWKGAEWIAYEEINDTAIIAPHVHQGGKKSWGDRRNILPLLRKSVSVEKKIKNATVFICGLGHFDMSINGKKVGDHFLDPGWTNYSKHALYVSFDVTSQLKQGNNAVGVMLGNGFYYIPSQRYRKVTGAYGLPKLIFRLQIEYADGEVENIVSDRSWKTAPSPIIFSSIFGGEDYDANQEYLGWDKVGFNDAQWKNVVITKGPPELNSQTADPLKVMEKFAVVKKNQLNSGEWIYDLGQNFSGIPSVTVTGSKGDTVKIIPAELLNEDGTANQKGSGGPSYFTYILKGGGQETWQPRFTYYGFRYLQVHCTPKDSLQKQPLVLKIEGWHTRNAAPAKGKFSSSNSLFNRTNALIDWAIKSNTMSVFTDCPHREKLGWLEETHLMGSSVQYNYDIANLCRKVIRDMINAQYPDGKIPEISPELTRFDPPFDESPEWGSASIILPWYNYEWYGDIQTLKEAYGMMKGYTGYLQNKSDKNILSHGLGDWFDIGPNRPGVSQLTPLGVTATAMYYYDLTIMIKAARLLGHVEDAAKYEVLAASVKKSFNEKFFDKKTFQYATGSQAANAMAVFMQLVEPGHKDQVIENLVNDIRKRNNALTAGDIGYRYVLRALEEAGRSDVIYDMNNRDDVPGYGYQLKHGATALTESWQAYPSVSNNHFMLGHLMEWFYTGLCGIKQSPDGVAYNKIEIRPQPVGDIKNAAASFHSPYGVIRSDWKKTGDNFQLNVTIPCNTSAEVFLPGNSGPVKIGSGTYSYSVKLK